MWIIEVIPIKRGLPKDSLTYFSAEPVKDGSVVSVPIRSKSIDAIVVGSRDARDEKSAIKSGSFSLKKILKIKDGSPVPPSLFETARLASQYYRTTRGTILNLLIPDYSFYGIFSHDEKTSDNKTSDIPALPERLLFQAPLDDRISFYRTFVREAFAKKESITLVCPTIADCELFSESLSRGIADFVVTLHSELPKKKLATVLKKLRDEVHSFLIICTPTYASLLRNDSTTIILEHESSTAYNTPSFPSFDFRVLIEIFARTSGKKYIVSDSLLRVETLGRYESHEFGTVAPITFRALAPIMLEIIPHGIPDELPIRARGEQIPALSNEMRTRLSTVASSKSKIFAFALRTGLATVTKCRDCRTILSCEYCTAPLVLYSGGEHRVFICNKCKRHTPSEQKCVKCNSWNLTPLGTGTEHVENEIRRLYPDIPTFRIDREATPSKSEARKVAAQFRSATSGILVGTEMALFYVSEDITDSIIVSFDTLFNIPSYRTNERIIELFLSIAERTRGKLYVQTKNPDEPILELVKSNNYSTWYRNELRDREEYHYPPFASIVKISWRGKESEKNAARDYLNEILSPFSPDIFESLVVTKGKRETAVHAVIRPNSNEWSIHSLLDGKGLSETIREALAKLPDDTVVSINPDNLL